jgi:hypothetical protein
MSRRLKPTLKLKLNRRSLNSDGRPRPVKVNEGASDSTDRATKLADRLVIACRENVRFLNFHLQRYERYLELPTMVDNALYLAYTIRVRENVPVDPMTLRRQLAEAGIETTPAFSFAASAEDCYTGSQINRIHQSTTTSSLDGRAFCLGCHQYLTILDLEYIIKTFDAILEPLVKADEKIPGKQLKRDEN